MTDWTDEWMERTNAGEKVAEDMKPEDRRHVAKMSHGANPQPERPVEEDAKAQ